MSDFIPRRALIHEQERQKKRLVRPVGAPPINVSVSPPVVEVPTAVEQDELVAEVAAAVSGEVLPPVISESDVIP